MPLASVYEKCNHHEEIQNIFLKTEKEYKFCLHERFISVGTYFVNCTEEVNFLLKVMNVCLRGGAGEICNRKMCEFFHIEIVVLILTESLKQQMNICLVIKSEFLLYLNYA